MSYSGRMCSQSEKRDIGALKSLMTQKFREGGLWKRRICITFSES